MGGLPVCTSEALRVRKIGGEPRWPPKGILYFTGDSPPASSKLERRQASPSGRQAVAQVGGSGAIAVPRQRTERQRARERAVPRTARCQTLGKKDFSLLEMT